MASIPIFSQLRGGRFNHRLSEVEPTTPAAPSKERDHLFNGAATPPFQGGESGFLADSPTSVSSRSLAANAFGKCPNVAAFSPRLCTASSWTVP